MKVKVVVFMYRIIEVEFTGFFLMIANFLQESRNRAVAPTKVPFAPLNILNSSVD